jgi:hypothetical protein
VTGIVTESSTGIEERDVQLHRRGGRQFETSEILAIRETSLRVTWMSAALDATLETDHRQQDQFSQIPPFLALVPRIAAAVSGGGEVAEILEVEEDLFTTTTGTGIMTHETAHRIVRIDHEAGRPYGEIVIFETNANLIGEIVMIADFRGSTTRTLDLLALRNRDREFWIRTAGPDRLNHGICQGPLQDRPHILHIMHPRQIG